MAKIRGTTPKKDNPNEKPEQPPPAPQLRRSPRKTVQSTQSRAAEAVSTKSQVVKAASRSKLSPKKAAPEKATPKKVAPKKATPTSKRKKSPERTGEGAASGASNASPGRKSSDGTTASASPKRGRPRKDPASRVTSSSPSKTSGTTKPVGRPRKDTNTETVVPAPAEEDSWTDSLEKKASSKRPARLPRNGSASVSKLLATQEQEHPDDSRDRQASLGGVRNSIEIPHTSRDSQSRSPRRQRSESPAKSPGRKHSRSPAKSPRVSSRADGAANSTSMRSRSAGRSRSLSPAKAQPLPRTRSASKSPSRKLSNQDRSSASPGGDLEESSIRVAKTRSTASRRPSGTSESPRRRSRSSEGSDFLARFLGRDVYGGALRKIEASAYRNTKDGRTVGGRNPTVGREDEQRAEQRGIQRAELELGLNKAASNKEQKIPGAKVRLVRVPEVASGRSTDRLNQPLQPGKPSAPGRGAIRSVTNPEFVPGTTTKNPFFETMPSKEVWHRNMPPQFPYGETPYIEQQMSLEISEDLAKGQEEMDEGNVSTGSLFGRATSAIKSGLSSLWRPSTPKDVETSSPWELPQVSESEVDEAANILQNQRRGGGKRKASASGISSPTKRTRREEDDQFMMSGALPGSFE